MRARLAIAAAVVAAAAFASGATRHLGFEADSFNRVYPAGYAKDAVFSPMAFEIDCVVFAESMDTLGKAHVAETMGVLVDLEGVYGPLLREFDNRTNGFSFVSARAFCVPDVRVASPAFRQQLQRELRVETCNLIPKEGIEAWLRATMDGEMDDFEVPMPVVVSDRFAYYDLVSVKAEFEQPFPAAGVKRLPFRLQDGNTVEANFLTDVREVDAWECKEYVLVRLPLKGGCGFYAMLPKGNVAVADVKGDISSLEIDRLVSSVKSLTDRGTTHSKAYIALPELRMTSRFDVSAVMRYYKFQYAGLVRVAGLRPPKEIVQVARFSVGGTDESREAVEAPQGVPSLVFDRPFVFFVYHEGTGTIPVAGQYTGVSR